MLSTRAPRITVAICTRNRATHLAQAVPTAIASADASEHPCEVVLVDNGSEDGTAGAIADLVAAHPGVRAASEPQAGLGRARNRAIAEARGEVIVFTDDDVTVPLSWVSAVVAPILAGDADMSGGTITLAPEADVPWLSPALKSLYLASHPALEPDFTLVGANMAIRADWARDILFDENLGTAHYPGGEDNVFQFQLHDRGGRRTGVPDAGVLHHPTPSRITHAHLRRQARGYGRVDAYVKHHWEGDAEGKRSARLVKAWGELLVVRLVERGRFTERLARAERDLGMHTELRRLDGTPRTYLPRGAGATGATV